MIKNINRFTKSVTNKDTTFNRTIEMSDLQGNVTVIVQCFCTISFGKSASYYFDVLEPVLYEENKLEIQVEIDSFIEEAKSIASRNNVPVY